MKAENKQLLEKALIAKSKYHYGVISKEEASEKIVPFVEAYNAKSKEVAKKYNQRPRLISFSSFVNQSAGVLLF
ncbi:hypothetical protein [Priestia megaterium]|uniref:hypothetical protein n=1 Tax=Priestia megaterium TaxID=1404 RepID=UPI000BED0410|nr:hypothetical protein [Priestia megaterium]PED64050.1 hypothetical protein CON20_24110 [Priestia megaterium]